MTPVADGPVVPWHATALASWVSQGGAPERGAIQSTWRGRAFDLAAALQSRLPRPAPGPSPLFVVGFWRSGTSLAHALLVERGGFGAPRTWQCFRPAAFQLHGAPRADRAPRPMDGMAVDTHSPQEDEIALWLLGVPSLYRGWMDPRRLEALATLTGGDGSDAMPTLQAFLTSVGVAEGRPLAVKSPNHLFRLPAIRRCWPDAPVLLLLRDAATLRSSNVRMWGAMCERYGLWAAPPGMLDRFVDLALHAGAAVLERLADDPGRLAAVPFDALRRDAPAALGAALGRLGLPPLAAGSAPDFRQSSIGGSASAADERWDRAAAAVLRVAG